MRRPAFPVCAQRGVTRTPAPKGVGKRGVPPPCIRGKQEQGAGEGHAQAGARSKRGRGYANCVTFHPWTGPDCVLTGYDYGPDLHH